MPRRRRKRRSLPAVLSLLAPLVWLGCRVPAAAAPVLSSAVVIEILDGDEMYIDAIKARLRSRANNPQRISTRASRGQMTFNTGAVGRINRFSQIRLGAQCFLLSGGQILISGNQNGCVRSARMSVRGTHYVMTREAGSDQTSVHALEGELLVERLDEDGRPSGERPTRLLAGWKLRLAGDGSVLALERIPRAEMEALLEGPLFVGFRPLPQAAALQQALARLYPGLTPGVASCAGTDTELMDAINAARVRSGRPPLPGLPAEQAQANCTYLEPILKDLMASSDCSHDVPRWEAFQREAARRFGRQATSEVIACPRPGTAWDPSLIVDTWMSSPIHHDILLNRPKATTLHCVRYNDWGRSVGICTLWRPEPHRGPLRPR